MEANVTLYTLLAENAENTRAEFEYVKSRFPPEVLTALPTLSSLTIDDLIEWSNPFGFGKRYLRRELLWSIKILYNEVRCAELELWYTRYSLLQEVMRRVFGSLRRAVIAVGVEGTEELLLKYYSWRLEADIPPRTNRWKKMKMFLEERRTRFSSD